MTSEVDARYQQNGHIQMGGERRGGKTDVSQYKHPRFANVRNGAAWAGTHLEKRVPSDDSKEPLEALAPALDDLVREPVREDLAGQRRDVDARALALEDVAERLEVAVPPPHQRVPQLERGDVRLRRAR